jgi:hypothetical protein
MSAANFLTSRSRENKCSSNASGTSSLIKSASFSKYSTFGPEGPWESRICLAISGRGAAPIQWTFQGIAMYKRASRLTGVLMLL